MPFQASPSISFVTILLSKDSHMARPKVRVKGHCHRAWIQRYMKNWTISTICLPQSIIYLLRTCGPAHCSCVQYIYHKNLLLVICIALCCLHYPLSNGYLKVHFCKPAVVDGVVGDWQFPDNLRFSLFLSCVALFFCDVASLCGHRLTHHFQFLKE